ncbi:MAG: DUF3108 domain-containing protein [Pseudolabrys sp.]|nr:DUF3108 domain-containing protein [Pseudolabrys sp.]
MRKQALVRRALIGSGLLGLIVGIPPVGASAQGKLEAHYEATLAGIPIGKGNWVVEIGDTHYNAAANGSTTGLIRVFTGGEGFSTVRGTMSGGKSISAVYSATIKTRGRSDEVHLVISNGNVKEFRLNPPPDNDPERIPITEAHEHGVVDPMSGSLLRVSGEGDLLAPESCKRSVAVFDGRLRYDLELAYKRIEQVKANTGYAGPALVCAVRFVPVAGFVPSRAAIKYIAKQRDIEVWLVPIAGTRVLVPFRMQGPTPIGEFRVEARQFVAAGAMRQAVGRAKAQ